MRTNDRSKMFVADSTPLGQNARVGSALVDTQSIRSQVNTSAARQQRIDQLIHSKHHGDMVTIAAERDYGDRKTSRRFEITPKFHLLFELSEMLKRGAFPAYTYHPGQMNMIHLVDAGDYDKKRAAEYFHKRLTELENLETMVTELTWSYAAALRSIINDYKSSIDGQAQNLSDLLYRELVDQVHRRTRSDVEAGLQPNTIEDPELVDETSGIAEAVELLYHAYARIEDIEAGHAAYNPFSDELYFSPSEIPMALEDSRNRFMRNYESMVNEQFASFFAGFDPSVTNQPDYMQNFMCYMKDMLWGVETKHGNYESLFIADGEQYLAGAHVEVVVDSMNSIRKKGNFLAALAYCLELAWNKAPDTQTASSFLLCSNIMNFVLQKAADGQLFCETPSVDGGMFSDSRLLSEIFINNPDPADSFAGVVSTYSHAERIMQVMFEEAEKGHLPMYNYKRGEWWEGVVFMQPEHPGAPDKPLSIPMFHKLIRQAHEVKSNALYNDLKSV